MKHFVDLGFVLAHSSLFLTWVILLGIFVHTIGQKLDWVSVCGSK